MSLTEFVQRYAEWTEREKWLLLREVAHNIGEAISLIEAGFEYVTGEYSDGGKIFRKRK